MPEKFTAHWMHDCNPYLILRFWRYKGRPGELSVKIFGIPLVYINTPFGELCIKGGVAEYDSHQT